MTTEELVSTAKSGDRSALSALRSNTDKESVERQVAR